MANLNAGCVIYFVWVVCSIVIILEIYFAFIFRLLLPEIWIFKELGPGQLIVEANVLMDDDGK